MAALLVAPAILASFGVSLFAGKMALALILASLDRGAAAAPATDRPTVR
jgi:hypothetical protein